MMEDRTREEFCRQYGENQDIQQDKYAGELTLQLSLKEVRSIYSGPHCQDRKLMKIKWHSPKVFPNNLDARIIGPGH